MLTSTSEVKKECAEKIAQMEADIQKKIRGYEDSIASKDEYIEHLLKVIEGKDQTIKRLQKEKQTLKATIQIFEKDERRKQK